MGTNIIKNDCNSFEKNIIEVVDLYKSFGEIKAVNGVSFTVQEGSLFAFLGTNGAGKSTTISIISTLLKKTAGKVFVCGKLLDDHDEDIRKDIGVVFQDSLLDPLLTVRENVIMRGSLYGIPKKEIIARMDKLAKSIDTYDYMNQRYGTLSGGQKRRADIVRALINMPKILILDEPTTGLDPSTRKKVWQIINKLKQEQGLTVFLTTHYMEEASIADKIVVINKGVIVAEGTPEELRLKYSKDRLHIMPILENKAQILELIKDKKYTEERDTIVVELDNSLIALDILKDIKNYIQAFEVIRGNMDDAFININSKCEETEV